MNVQRCGWIVGGSVLACAAVLIILGVVAVTPVRAADRPLLVEKHKNAGLACDACHAENPPKTAAPVAACTGCHGTYEKLAELTDKVSPHNPHQSHEGEIECGECHHVHKASVDYCAKCHQFGFTVP